MRNPRRWSALIAAAFLTACSSSPTSETPPAGASGDLGFRPAKDGFPFENYGEAAGIDNLTAEEMRRMFGDKVCATTGATCALTPPAAEWMANANKAMSVGHCEGMAVLSALFYAKKAAPADFGAPAVSGLAIAGNPKLQREIAYWWTTQVTAGSSRNMSLTPNELVDKLAQAFKEGADKETYSLAFFKRDKTGGHAVTPYAVDLGDGHKATIKIYDNNYPGKERSIEVDRDANTWRYFASQNPAEASSEYSGDATTRSLGFTPSSARLAQQACAFCGNVSVQTPAQPAPRQLQVSGAANVLVKDDAGNQTGTANGEPVNTIPGAEVAPLLGDGPSYWDAKRPPAFTLPGNGALTVTLDGSSPSGATPSDVMLTGAGFVLAVDDIQLDPGQKDTLTFSADNTEVGYKTSGSESPRIVLGVQLDGADYEFAIKVHGAASGVEVAIKMDLAAGKLRVSVKGGTYDVEVQRIGDADSGVFTHKAAGGDADVFFFDYEAWEGNGMPMKVEVDKGGDGSIDTTESLGDEE
ncbi:hypothetical protein BH11MYX4_BH11MYX4_52840 [soil metagenome]